jgi:hypothetical protein
MPHATGPGRADLRRLDPAVGARRPDGAAAPGPAGDQQQVPAARDARQDRHDRRYRLPRTAGLRNRHGLTPQLPTGADLWNIPGGDIADAAQRSALLDRYCTEIGRDPAAITRSIALRVSYDQPGTTRDAISEALDAGFRHITLGLPTEPYPANVGRWVADELIAKSR